MGIVESALNSTLSFHQSRGSEVPSSDSVKKVRKVYWDTQMMIREYSEQEMTGPSLYPIRDKLWDYWVKERNHYWVLSFHHCRHPRIKEAIFKPLLRRIDELVSCLSEYRNNPRSTTEQITVINQKFDALFDPAQAHLRKFSPLEPHLQKTFDKRAVLVHSLLDKRFISGDHPVTNEHVAISAHDEPSMPPRIEVNSKLVPWNAEKGFYITLYKVDILHSSLSRLDGINMIIEAIIKLDGALKYYSDMPLILKKQQDYQLVSNYFDEAFNPSKDIKVCDDLREYLRETWNKKNQFLNPVFGLYF